jgi:predicted nuclease with TOPRIM domain
MNTLKIENENLLNRNTILNNELKICKENIMKLSTTNKAEIENFHKLKHEYINKITKYDRLSHDIKNEKFNEKYNSISNINKVKLENENNIFIKKDEIIEQLTTDLQIKNDLIKKLKNNIHTITEK